MTCGHMGLLGGLGPSFQDFQGFWVSRNKQMQHEMMWEGLTNSLENAKAFSKQKFRSLSHSLPFIEISHLFDSDRGLALLSVRAGILSLPHLPSDVLSNCVL